MHSPPFPFLQRNLRLSYFEEILGTPHLSRYTAGEHEAQHDRPRSPIYNTHPVRQDPPPAGGRLDRVAHPGPILSARRPLPGRGGIRRRTGCRFFQGSSLRSRVNRSPDADYGRIHRNPADSRLGVLAAASAGAHPGTDGTRRGRGSRREPISGLHRAADQTTDATPVARNGTDLLRRSARPQPGHARSISHRHDGPH